MRNLEHEKMKYFGNQWLAFFLEKIKMIIFIIQLMIALLVIVSFSGNIIHKQNLGYLKGLIIFLLFLIPIMMVDYTLKINDGLNSLQKALSFKAENEKWYYNLICNSSLVYISFVTLVVDIVIYLISQNIQINQNIQIVFLCLLFQIIFIYILFKNSYRILKKINQNHEKDS